MTPLRAVAGTIGKPKTGCRVIPPSSKSLVPRPMMTRHCGRAVNVIGSQVVGRLLPPRVVGRDQLLRPV